MQLHLCIQVRESEGSIYERFETDRLWTGRVVSDLVWCFFFWCFFFGRSLVYLFCHNHVSTLSESIQPPYVLCSPWYHTPQPYSSPLTWHVFYFLVREIWCRWSQQAQGPTKPSPRRTWRHIPRTSFVWCISFDAHCLMRQYINHTILEQTDNTTTTPSLTLVIHSWNPPSFSRWL